MWWSHSYFFSVWIHCVWTEFNLETNGTVEHLIIKRFLSICGGLSLSLSVCGFCCLWIEFNQETIGTVVYFIIKRFLSICGGLYLSLSVCGSWRLWTQFNLETNGIVEHQIFQAMCLSMWWSNSFCFNVWNHLPVHLIHQWISVNMLWSVSFSFSMLRQMSVNRCQWRNNWNSWSLNLSNVVFHYVGTCLIIQ